MTYVSYHRLLCAGHSAQPTMRVVTRTPAVTPGHGDFSTLHLTDKEASEMPSGQAMREPPGCRVALTALGSCLPRAGVLSLGFAEITKDKDRPGTPPPRRLSGPPTGQSLSEEGLMRRGEATQDPWVENRAPGALHPLFTPKATISVAGG